MLFTSSQEITMEVIFPDTHKVIITCVYASCLKQIRQELWDHLDDIYGIIQTTNSPRLLAGDFNCHCRYWIETRWPTN